MLLPTRAAFLLIVAIVLSACAQRSVRREDSAVALAAAPRDTSALGRFVSQLDTSCDFVQARLHPDPTALATEFVQRAGRGDFNRAEDWLPGAVTCIGHESGYDTFAVADTVILRPLDSTATQRRFELRLHEIGNSSEGSFYPGDSASTDTLSIVSTPFGWRIENPYWNWLTVDAAAQKGWLADTVRR